MPSGTIVHWVSGKTFGFIKPNDGSADLFIHVSSLRGSLRKGGSAKVGNNVWYNVIYDEQRSRNNPIDVEPLEEATVQASVPPPPLPFRHKMYRSGGSSRTRNKRKFWYHPSHPLAIKRKKDAARR